MSKIQEKGHGWHFRILNDNKTKSKYCHPLPLKYKEQNVREKMDAESLDLKVLVREYQASL